MKISVIICTYNRCKYIYNALKSVAENDFPTEDYEVILVNNNCTDDTEKESLRFRNDFPQIEFKQFFECNQGLSYARNRGIRESRGEMLVFLDDDAFVQTDYLKNLSRFLSQYPDAMAYGGKISPVFETGREPDWLGRWSYSWVSALDKGSAVSLFAGRSYPIGANMGIRKSVFDSCGTFNVELGRSKNNLNGGEEKDMFDRIAKGGHKIYYFPNIEAKHVIPPHRVTIAFIKRLGYGVGVSERRRTLGVSRTQYLKRLFSECVKWFATMMLLIGYVFMLSPKKGVALLLFRWNVSRGLCGW